MCFPFDLTGPTGRRGRSSEEKFNEWRNEHEGKAAAEGRKLTIEPWPASKIRSLLLDADSAGGIRAFFFDETILTQDWFSTHLDSATATARPRYSPNLHVETDLWKWFAALGRTTEWSRTLEDKVRFCRKVQDRLVSALRRTPSDPVAPTWPEDSREDAQSLVAAMPELLDRCTGLTTADDAGAYRKCITEIGKLLEGLASLEARLTADLKNKHGRGRADSPGFRQFMAEYMVSFPAANLDTVREVLKAFGALSEWLESPTGSLAFQPAFVLSGAAGSGKTHGVCDAAERRLRHGLLTCVIFGHAFGGEPDPWTRTLESLGLPLTLGRDGLLDALNSAAEASGSPLIICIDAINETRPLRYWRERLTAMAQEVRRRPYLRLCVTCRTSFLPYCLPDGHGLIVVEHLGFAGIEREACKAFFQHYALKPPIAPILQPELSNPLYLKLVCETLQAQGLDRLPLGWFGLAPAIKTFLEEKERQFAVEHETSIGANIVRGSLRAIARALANSGESALAWSHAQQVISHGSPQAATLRVLEWLVRADLLIEDAPHTGDQFGDESTIRPAFERLGDFLIAEPLLAKIIPSDIRKACQPGGPLHALLTDRETVARNSGVISALSILLPEQFPGLELPELISEPSVRAEVLKVTVRSFPWRNPATFCPASRSLILEGLGIAGFMWEVLDAVVSVSWQPSAIDAIWLDEVLTRKPLATRDAVWCVFLHNRYESRGSVRRLIEAAFELPLDDVETEVAERWSKVLLWFTAAADRRVKDRATRAVTALVTARPEIIPVLLTRMLHCDDDEIRERALLSCYGALINSRHIDVIKTTIGSLYSAFRDDPSAFDNALIRDHIRCIAELADQLDALPDGCDPELTVQPIGAGWPLHLPSDEEIKRWEELPKLAHSCLDDDFFTYTLNCLRPWEHAVPKRDMGKWILQKVARDFRYEGSGCERYDGHMLAKYGGGRGKPTWAERIGKKYQWVAMYQLASRLHDHVEREHENWAPQPQRTPLILVEERKLDPTLPSAIADGERDSNAWWIGASADLRSGEHLSDADWVARQDDLPTLEKLLAVQERGGQRWRLLVAYPSWGRPEEDAGWRDPYRQVWVHIESYLVRKEEIRTAYDCLRRRNFFGKWMPEGATWLHGFAGEYPWATPLNTEPEEWHGRGGHGRDLPVSYTPSWSRLAVEWEYDASLPRRFRMIVPAREFFAREDLWWDGRDGYRLVDGRTVFRDPSVTEGGPAALVADADDLFERLEKLGFGLIWILLGEKWILGGRFDKQGPRRTFSQIARLHADGSVEIGERAFFEDYNQDSGPLPVDGE